MWKKLKAFVLRKAGYGPCFSCGKIGLHGFVRTQTRKHWTFTTQEGHKAILYKATLSCEGLCGKCFDTRADQWTSLGSPAFEDLFEERETVKKG
jgi:hypothetical protein